MLQSFKNEVKVLARDNGLDLSGYIKYLLTQQLKKAKKRLVIAFLFGSFYEKIF